MTVQTLNSSKSTGPNIISMKIMKTIKDEISIPLYNLINKSFNIGIFPNISKREARQLCNNYRPISLLSNISNTIEKLMHLRPKQFLESQTNLFSVLIF